MTELELSSGLIVRDRRAAHQRAAREFPQIDPHDHIPNDNGPGSPVGPGVGGTTVMYPEGGWHASSWDGWPTEWHTPPFGPDWSGEGYGRQNEMWGRVSTVMSCASLNARELASFPIYGVDKTSAPFALPGWSSNPEPAMYSCWSEFMHAAVLSIQLRGEAFLYATGRAGINSDGAVTRFIVLNPDVVDAEWIDGEMVYSIAGGELEPADICHVRYLTWPGRPHGVSPLEWIAGPIATSSALERYAANLAARGGIPWAVLKARGNIDKTQAETIQARWVSAAARRDGAPAVMGGDIDLQALSIAPRDMALLELREFDERRICAALGVPSFLVNVEQSNSMTYANVSQVYDAHWRQTLRPLAQLLADAWSSWLLPRGSRMEFNPDRYVQPPLAERVAAWATMFNIVDPVSGERAISIDEIRSAERLIPQPNLDAAARLTGAAT